MDVPDGDKCDLAALLFSELDEVANRPQASIFKRHHGKGSLAIPHLRHLTRALHPTLWKSDHLAALIELLKAAAGHKLLNTPFHDGTTMTWGEFAYRIYNLEGENLEHVDGREYTYRLDTAIEVAGLTNIVYGRTRTRKLANLREKISTALIDLTRDSEDVTAVDAKQTAGSRPNAQIEPTLLADGDESFLIERPECIEQINGLATNGGPVFIWGEPGTGKSTLAAQAAVTLSHDPVTILRAGDEKALKDDVVEALIVEGMEPDSWSEVYCRARLRRVLSEAQCTGVVIVDDLEDEDLLWQLVPARPRIPVLVTRRTKPRSTTANVVAVYDLTESQARTLIAQRLNDATDVQVSALIMLLGCRPLALDHAIRYVLETPGVQVADLLALLTGQVTTGLDLVAHPTFQAKNLTRLYKATLPDVLRDEVTSVVLDCFLSLTGVSGFERYEYILYVLERGLKQPLARAHIHTALRILANYGLIVHRDRYLVMHRLTCAMMRELRGSAVAEVEREFTQFLLNCEIEPQVTDERVGQKDARIAQMHLQAGTDLQDGWLHLRCIDQRTWVAVRTESNESGKEMRRTVRYEVLATGVYRFDYDSRKRSKLATNEARQLYEGLMLYNDMCDAMTISDIDRMRGACFSDWDQLQKFTLSGDSELLRELAYPAGPRAVQQRNSRQRQALQIAALDKRHSLSEEYGREAYQRFVQLTGATPVNLSSGTMRLPPPELLAIVTWLLDDGRQQVALEIIDRHQVTGNSAQEVRIRSEFAAIRARAFLAFGDWTAAKTCIASDIKQLDHPRLSRNIQTYGLVRALSLSLDRILMSGADEEELQRIQNQVHEAWNARPKDFNSPVTEVRRQRLVGRSSTAIAQLRAQRGVDKAELQDILTHGRSCLESAWEGAKGVVRSRVEREEIFYDLVLADYLMGRLGSAEILRLAAQRPAGHYIDAQCSYRLFLLGCKASISEDTSRNTLNYGVLGFYKSLCQHFGYQLESAYWYCECLAVLCILTTQYGFPDSGYRKAAKESYEYIGRLDRWQRLEELLTAEHGDPLQQHLKTSYLLAW